MLRANDIAGTTFMVLLPWQKAITRVHLVHRVITE